MEKRYLNIREVSEYLGFKPSAIRKWIRFGKIPFNRFNGNIRFDRTLINQWAEKTLEPASKN